MSDATNVQTTYDREGNAFDTPMWLFAMANDQDGWYHVNYPAVPDGPHGDDEGRTWVRHHPALPAVARWLNDNPDGATELWAHLDDLGEERETPRLRSLRDALGDALSTDGGA